MKFNAILHPSEHSERICLYLVRQFEAELAKLGHFQISKSIFEVRYDSIFLIPKLLFGYQIRRTIFIKSIYFFNHSCKTLFSKNAGSTSNCFTRYKQILSGSSLECKNALKFTRLSMKFYNCGHTSGHILTYATNTKSFGTTLFSFPGFQPALPRRVAGTHLRKEKSTPKVM